MFGVVAPMVCVAAIPFFMIYTAMVRYNIIFIYTQEYDSGGEFFFTLVNCSYFSLVLSLVLLQAYLGATRKNIHWVAQGTESFWEARYRDCMIWVPINFFLPLLIIVVSYLWYYTQAKFK